MENEKDFDLDMMDLENTTPVQPRPLPLPLLPQEDDNNRNVKDIIKDRFVIKYHIYESYEYVVNQKNEALNKIKILEKENEKLKKENEKLKKDLKISSHQIILLKNIIETLRLKIKQF